MRQQILKLRLEGFRTYSTLELNLDADLVFFIGANGAGKTSILEGIGVAGLLRSFRGAGDRDLIHFNASFYSCSVSYRSGTTLCRQHVAFGKVPAADQSKEANRDVRRMSVNGEKIARSSEYIGKLQTVFFSPDDIDIIDSGPAERRRFLDIQLSSLYPGYYEKLQQYNRSLKLRSALLRSSPNPDKKYLEALDRELASAGIVILKHRKAFIEKFRHPFLKYVDLISGSKDEWQMDYLPSLEADNKNEYALKLSGNLSRDLRLKQTTLGIHRDQLQFIRPNLPLSPDLAKIASQGQKRTVALSLKMAQYELVKEIKGENPVLLIDDVLNELDAGRRKHFVHFLHEIGQALITTTDIDAIQDYIQERQDIKILVYQISNGKVENGADSAGIP